MLNSAMQDSAELGLAARLFFDVVFEETTMHLQALLTLGAVNSRKGLVVRALLQISNPSKSWCLCRTDSELHHAQKYAGSLTVRLTTAISPVAQFGVAP
jgi:hypothetical protein